MALWRCGSLARNAWLINAQNRNYLGIERGGPCEKQISKVFKIFEIYTYETAPQPKRHNAITPQRQPS